MTTKHVIEKEISFEAGHRLMNYEGKCKWLHGHNYKLRAGLSSKETNNQGFVRDFGEIKDIIKSYIDEKIDHGMVLNVNDLFWTMTLKNNQQKIYIMNCNPTAENMAEHFYHLFKVEIPELIYIEIEETPTSTARYGE